MNTYKINLTSPPVLIEDTIDFVELAQNPIKTVLMLRSEFSLFMGDRHVAEDYINGIMLSLEFDASVLPSFLDKTVGDSEKVNGLFSHFNESFQITIKETEYFGSLLLSPSSKEKLGHYIENPFDENCQNEFIDSLQKIVTESEARLDKEYDILLKYISEAVIEE